MNMELLKKTDWSDAYFADTPPTITYRMALTVYEESLIKGRFVGRG